MKIKPKQNIPLEFEEQVLVVEFLELMNLKFTAIPNGAFIKNGGYRIKKKLHDEGLRGGLPDLLIVLPNKLLFIEMKRIKLSVTSSKQKEWIEALNGIGKQVEAVICRGGDEAIAKIQEELKQSKHKDHIDKLLKPYRVE